MMAEITVTPRMISLGESLDDVYRLLAEAAIAHGLEEHWIAAVDRLEELRAQTNYSNQLH
jgi:hypothetical protein